MNENTPFMFLVGYFFVVWFLVAGFLMVAQYIYREIPRKGWHIDPKTKQVVHSRIENKPETMSFGWIFLLAFVFTLSIFFIW